MAEGLQQLSEHFTLAEMSITTHRDIDNRPPITIVAQLRKTAQSMENVRALVRAPITCLSGFRCDDLNCIIGGAMTEVSLSRMAQYSKYEIVRVVAQQRLSKLNVQQHDSQHMVGEALDFIAPGFGSPLKVCRKIMAAGIRFDQLIYESSWVHISFSKNPRGDVLTWIPHDGYERGLPAREALSTA